MSNPYAGFRCWPGQSVRAVRDPSSTALFADLGPNGIAGLVRECPWGEEPAAGRWVSRAVSHFPTGLISESVSLYAYGLWLSEPLSLSLGLK